MLLFRWFPLVVIVVLILFFLEQRCFQFSQYLSLTTNAVVKGYNTTETEVIAVQLSQQQQQKDMVGEWIGNVWIPPNEWKLYTTKQIQNLYNTSSIIWIGDSTARRTSMTLYSILNYNNNINQKQQLLLFPTVDDIDSTYLLNLNKLKIQEPCNVTRWDKNNSPYYPNICKTINDGNDDLVYLGLPCTTFVKEFFISELNNITNILQDFNIIILAFGLWESRYPEDCFKEVSNRLSVSTKGEVPSKNSIKQYQIEVDLVINETIALIDKWQKQNNINKIIIWRTSGYAQYRNKVLIHQEWTKEFTTIMNRNVIRTIEEYRQCNQSKITYVDFGTTMLQRSFERQRIEGDLPAHYGIEARLALIQMISNTIHSELGAPQNLQQQRIEG